MGWYGLLLLVVLSVFGTLLYWQASTLTLKGVDAELEAHAKTISASLEWDEQDGWELEISGEYLRGMSEDVYCTVRSPDGTVLFNTGDVDSRLTERSPGFYSNGDLREVEVSGLEGARVLIGRSIAPERKALSRLLLQILATGLAVLVLGLCGGGWLANRSLSPISALTESASKAGPNDLSSRLDVDAAPEELRELSTAFNASLDRLSTALEARRRFTADASHELRTPIATLRSQAESALRRERTPDEYQATLAACLRASKRMSDLVEGLLTLASADTGVNTTHTEEVDLRILVEERIEAWRERARRAGINLFCVADKVVVRGDPLLLANVLDNLLANAIRYSDSGGRVEVSLDSEDSSAVLQVSDHGIGIQAEALPHVFERFYRADFARSREQGGFGLGLAIAMQIVEAHGGSIEAESQWGEGSTFTVRVPRIDLNTNPEG